MSPKNLFIEEKIPQNCGFIPQFFLHIPHFPQSTGSHSFAQTFINQRIK